MGHDEATGPNLGMDNLNTIDESGAGQTEGQLAFGDKANAAWGDGSDDDLDLGDDDDEPTPDTNTGTQQKETLQTQAWIQREDPIRHQVLTNSLISGEHFAIGNFEKGRDLLVNQIGLLSQKQIATQWADL